MASAKILENKKAIVAEITDKIKNSESVIIFTYQGLTVADLAALRVKLHEIDSEVKVYKNTLVRRAVEDLNINLDGFLEGPNAIVFGKDLLEPIKVISEFAKEQEKEAKNIVDKDNNRKIIIKAKIWKETSLFLYLAIKIIEMRTDNRDLFQYSLVSLSKYGYIFDNISLDLPNHSLNMLLPLNDKTLKYF